MKPVNNTRAQQSIIVPDWPAPANVYACATTRSHVCHAPKSLRLLTGYDDFNLALHVDDTAEKVLENRASLAQMLAIHPSSIAWLEQVHSNHVVNAELTHTHTRPARADASFTQAHNQTCAIMTADCLPVLFCYIDGTSEQQHVAAAHAGWRGLANGILSKTLATFSRPENVMAWLGPAISQKHFEVGEEVYDAFVSKDSENKQAFSISPNSSPEHPKFLASLHKLAKVELKKQGISAIYGDELCTYANADTFYSYRRDGARSGRMASLIMITE